MANTPDDITPLLNQAWNQDPEENFFEFMADVLQSNQTLYSLADITNEELSVAFQEYMTREEDNEEVNDTEETIAD